MNFTYTFKRNVEIDVEEVINTHLLTTDSTSEDIDDAIEGTLAGFDDDVYYNRRAFAPNLKAAIVAQLPPPYEFTPNTVKMLLDLIDCGDSPTCDIAVGLLRKLTLAGAEELEHIKLTNELN